MKAENNEKITQLQMLDQNIQQILMQKQQFQSQMIELNNSIDEIEKSKGKVYKIIGAIMVTGEKDILKGELESKKEIVEIRIKSIEKQENQLKEKASRIQSDVMSELKSKGE